MKSPLRLAVRKSRSAVPTWKQMQPSTTQRAFIESPVKDVVFGGARGGGKSQALLLDFASYAGTYGAKARGGLFRRTFTELEELIYRGQRYLVDELGWEHNATAHLFTCIDSTDPAYGATLRMAYLKNLDDARIYAGWELSWCAFDEMGNWADPAPLDILMGSMRSSPGIPTYRRGTCMPGGPGHSWVKERYRPDRPYEVRKYQPMPKEFPELEVDVQFIPSKLEDNPFIDQRAYEANLALLGNAKLFAAWRRGDWSLVAGAFFDCWDEDVHVLHGARPEFQSWNPLWMACDWGFRDDCAVGWYGQDEAGLVTKRAELKVNNTSPKDVGRLIAKTTVQLGLGKQVLFAMGPDAWSPLKTSPHTIADELAEGVRDYLVEEGEDPDLVPFPYKADTDREGGWMFLYQMLSAKQFVVHESCVETRRSIPAMQHDEKNSADVADSKLDHFPDETRYALKTYLGSQRIPREERMRRTIEKSAPGLLDRIAAREAAQKRGGGPIVGAPIYKPGMTAEEREAANDYTRLANIERRESSRERSRYRRPGIARARIGQ